MLIIVIFHSFACAILAEELEKCCDTKHGLLVKIRTKATTHDVSANEKTTSMMS